ncbi:MAG: hydrogen gas-evolving membrane-bound hydrogenase subunit E [Bacillota bacterium]
MPPNTVLVAITAIVVLYLAFRFIPGLQARSVLTLLLLGLIGFFLVITVAEMPPFGEPGNPDYNEIPQRFLERGVTETGAVNVVSGIILDYRAFDTFGEVTVLFTAIAAVVAALKAHQ